MSWSPPPMPKLTPEQVAAFARVTPLARELLSLDMLYDKREIGRKAESFTLFTLENIAKDPDAFFSLLAEALESSDEFRGSEPLAPQVRWDSLGRQARVDANEVWVRRLVLLAQCVGFASARLSEPTWRPVAVLNLGTEAEVQDRLRRLAARRQRKEFMAAVIGSGIRQ